MIVKTTLNLKFRKVSTDTSLYMCRVILCLLFLFSFSKLCLAQDEKEMLQQLDNLIEDQSKIIRAKEQRIQLIKDRFRIKNLTDKQKYDINETLYQEYMAFKCDSAYYYVTKNMELAKRRNGGRPIIIVRWNVYIFLVLWHSLILQRVAYLLYIRKLLKLEKTVWHIMYVIVISMFLALNLQRARLFMTLTLERLKKGGGWRLVYHHQMK